MHDDGIFDEAVAERYDRSVADMFAPDRVEPAANVLAELARRGRALEFGVGTGRLALPLVRRGIPVHGIDVSRPMVARLRSKPDGERVDVTIGDFATSRIDGTFTVVYLVFNTLGNVTTQEAQVACFENAARHLEPGGAFVVELEVPDLRRLPPGDTFRVFQKGEDNWGIDEYDVAHQRLMSHHLRVQDGRVQRTSVPFRYAWPAELDLMARLAGLSLRSRWADWDASPFTSESRSHVSIWEKPA